MRPKRAGAARIPRVREGISGTHRGRWMSRAEQKFECKKARRHLARQIARTHEEP